MSYFFLNCNIFLFLYLLILHFFFLYFFCIFFFTMSFLFLSQQFISLLVIHFSLISSMFPHLSWLTLSCLFILIYFLYLLYSYLFIYSFLSILVSSRLCLTDWLTDCLTDWLTDWLTGLTDWLTDQLCVSAYYYITCAHASMQLQITSRECVLFRADVRRFEWTHWQRPRIGAASHRRHKHRQHPRMQGHCLRIANAPLAALHALWCSASSAYAVVQVPLLLVDPAAWALQARFLHRPDQKSIHAVGREKASPIDLEVDSVLLHHLDGLEDVEGDLLLERNLELEDDRWRGAPAGAESGTRSWTRYGHCEPGVYPLVRILQEMRETIWTRGQVPFSVPFSGYGSGHRFLNNEQWERHKREAMSFTLEPNKHAGLSCVHCYHALS